MDSLAVQLIRGTDKPDLIVADSNYYRLYLQSMQSIQRVTDGGNSSHGGVRRVYSDGCVVSCR